MAFPWENAMKHCPAWSYRDIVARHDDHAGRNHIDSNIFTGCYESTVHRIHFSLILEAGGW